jgi:hypothetical protein
MACVPLVVESVAKLCCYGCLQYDTTDVCCVFDGTPVLVAVVCSSSCGAMLAGYRPACVQQSGHGVGQGLRIMHW